MLRIATELVRLGNTVDIYTISWDGEPPEPGIRVRLVKTGGLVNYKRYDRFIRSVRPEILLAGADLIVGFSRMPGLDAYFAADPCLIERAHRERGFLYRLSSRYRWFSRNEHAVFDPSSACEILILTAREKKDFQLWYKTPDERFHLLPPFLSAERMALQDKARMRQRLREEFGFDEGEYVLLMVGSGFRTKGLDRAIQAVKALPAEIRVKTRLLAVGQDNPKVFQRLASDLGVASRVRITSGRGDIPQLMQGADLLIHPARRELAGHVLLEAMASGLPVLVTEVCGYAFHIRNAAAGEVLSMPFEQVLLNERLAEMLLSDRRESWASNGIEYAGRIMAENDGSAEARILMQLAAGKKRDA